jgi:hypothetical protein
MRNRSQIAGALVFILIGSWLLAVQLIPALKGFFYGGQTWPFAVIAVGAGLGLLGLLLWVPGLMVPACIVSGIGGLLYYQNLTGSWDTWAYAWALIPGFVGAGVSLAGLMQRSGKMVGGGLWTIFNSLVLFVVFGSFLGGGERVFRYWPVVLITLGVILLGRGVLRRPGQ